MFYSIYLTQQVLLHYLRNRKHGNFDLNVVYGFANNRMHKTFELSPGHISGGRGRPWGIFFGLYKTRHILLSNGANCTVLRAVVLTQYRRVTDTRTDRQTDRQTELP